MHVLRSSCNSNPFSHLQVKEPLVLRHVCSQPPLLNRHSSTSINESETSERAMQSQCCASEGFAIAVQTTRDDVYAMQSQLRDRQSRVGIEPLAFELETEEPINPLAITAKELGGF